MVTIKDVANLAGVSDTTVSIILNGQSDKRKISQKTQHKVWEAVKKLNYQPNISARKLRSYEGNKPAIAIYWASDFCANLMARFLRGLQDEIVTKYNYDIIICPYKIDYLHIEKGLKNANMFNAAIIANASKEDMEYLENSDPQIPVVLYNRTSSKYSTVNINNREASEKAALLFAQNGHKNVAIMVAEPSYFAMDLRTKAFMESCNSHHMNILDEHIIRTDNSIEGGIRAANDFVKLINPPKALFCNSDVIALGALHTFSKIGIKVPEDVEIITIGLGGIEYTEFSTPPLTIIDLPMEKMAGSCIKLISEIIERNVEEPSSIYFDTPLFIRESCRPHKKSI